jgi:hypothetical protein
MYFVNLTLTEFYFYALIFVCIFLNLARKTNNYIGKSSTRTKSINNNKILHKVITQDHHNNPTECLVVKYDTLLMLLPPSVNGYHNSTSSFGNR